MLQLNNKLYFPKWQRGAETPQVVIIYKLPLAFFSHNIIIYGTIRIYNMYHIWDNMYIDDP